MVYEWERRFQSHILSRGWNYAADGAVSGLNKNGDTVTAVVEGTEYYRVEIGYIGSMVSEAYCSCPYAADGNWCKHMAAVLYEIECSEFDNVSISPRKEKKPEIKPSTVKELVAAVDREKLESLLLGLADSDPRVESYIRSSIRDKKLSVDIKKIENEIDGIFMAFAGHDGYIDYNNASDFECSLVSLLENRAQDLIDDEKYEEAFDLSVYAYVKTGNCDIDDDGQLNMIADACSKIWRDIIIKCPDDTYDYIREWFEENAASGIVYDFMDDYLCDFLKYELASKEELEEEIYNLDKVIEESKNKTECAKVYSCLYGYYTDALELRIKLMKKLGATDDDVDKLRRQYWNFKNVREYFYSKAKQENDIEEQIHIIMESKIIDKDSEYRVHRYSEELIEIYHNLGDYDKEKKERYESYISYYEASIDEFRKYREMCTPDEWMVYRRNLIDSKKDIKKKCELLAEEKLLDELFETIWNQTEKLKLVNKYGFLLADNYSSEILNFYKNYVSKLAEVACNRSRYDELIGYLLRMRHYKYGNDLVISLCKDWSAIYHTRKVMVQELSKLIY